MISGLYNQKFWDQRKPTPEKKPPSSKLVVSLNINHRQTNESISLFGLLLFLLLFLLFFVKTRQLPLRSRQREPPVKSPRQPLLEVGPPGEKKTRCSTNPWPGNSCERCLGPNKSKHVQTDFKYMFCLGPKKNPTKKNQDIWSHHFFPIKSQPSDCSGPFQWRRAWAWQTKCCCTGPGTQMPR